MKNAEYKLAGEVPEVLRGKTIKTREAESLDEMHTLVDEGKPENVLALAQAQWDIIIQRKLREAATSEVVGGILAGKEVEVDGEKLDFASATDDEKLEHALGFIQKIADTYAYGRRVSIPGAGREAAKKNAATVNTLASAASNDPELAAKLAALGISL